MDQRLETVRARLDGGFFPAVPATLRADGSLDAAAHRDYVAWMATQPVGGVAVWAHTGRGLWLDQATRRAVLSHWAEGKDNRLVIAGVGSRAGEPARHRSETLELAAEAIDLGADALMLYPPVLFRGADDQDARVLDHAAAVCALGAPVVLFYLYEAAGGIAYSPDLLRRLLALPGAVGIKMATLDSVMTYQDVAAQLAAEAPRVVLISGEDRFLGYSLMCGAGAALVGMGAVCCGAQAALLRAWREPDLPTFVRLSAAVDRFSRATFRAPMEGYIQRLLWCLADQGVVPEAAACDPFGPPLDPAEREAVVRAARELCDVA